MQLYALFIRNLIQTLNPDHLVFPFSLFDEEGDGLIKWYNFRMIEKVLLSQTKMGRDHRDHGDLVVHVHKV